MEAEARALSERLLAVAAQIYRTRKSLPMVERDSPPWRQWRQWRETHGLPVDLMDRMERWSVPTLEPPDDIADLEAEWAGRQSRGLKAGTREALGRNRKDTP